MGSILADLHTRAAITAESIKALSTTQIADLLDTAMLVASLACGRHGADPPTVDDLAAVSAPRKVDRHAAAGR
jgi:fructokinase